jgi:hypothetical protein
MLLNLLLQLFLLFPSLFFVFGAGEGQIKLKDEVASVFLL